MTLEARNESLRIRHLVEVPEIRTVIQLEDHHPIRVKKIIDDRLVDFCIYEQPENRRQDLKPPAYIRNGSIYAMKKDVLYQTGARYGTENSRHFRQN